jgi:hypothetical protein
MKSRYDLVKLGFALGVIAPIISFLIVYKIKFDSFTLKGFYEFLVTMHALSKLLSLMVIPNLLIFFIFIWTNHLYAARGVLAATVFDAVVIMAIKFLT